MPPSRLSNRKLIGDSAAICAIIKTTKLYQLADLRDFTCECIVQTTSRTRARAFIDMNILDGTVDLIIWVQSVP